MAGRTTEARITALLSLLAVTLLAHALLLQPPPSSPTACSPRALQFDSRQLVVELVTRRNMIFLCHAILLLILRDAGILAAPAARRGTTAASTTAGRKESCSEAQPKPKSIVEMKWTSTAAAGASDASSPTVADDGRVKRERRRSPRPDKTTPRPRRGKPSPVARDIGPADKQSTERERCFFDHGVGSEIAAVEDEIVCLHSEPVTDDERSRGGEEMPRRETEPECVDDVDEMNKKFEEFIASMRRKMQLESRQLIKV